MANVTIKDIAQACKLSLSTTSCALRGVGRVAPETVAKVRQVAQKMGYKPNLSARAIRTGQFGVITLLLSSKASASVTTQSMLWGIFDVLDTANRHLTILRLPEFDLQKKGALPKILTEQFSDGVLINYYHAGIPATLSGELDKLSLPYVWLNYRYPVNAVYPNDLEGSRFITEFLLRRGRQRIVYANFYLSEQDKDLSLYHYSTADRWNGYRLAMEAAGLSPVWMRSKQPLNSAERVIFAKEWLQREDRPEAIICYNEWTSDAIALAARLVGLEIPRDLVIVVFTEETYDRFDLPICIMRVSFQEIGQEGTRLLLERLQNPGKDLSSRSLSLPCLHLDLLTQ